MLGYVSSVPECQKLSTDCCDMINQSLEESTERSTEECRKQKFDDASQWLLEDWISTLAKGGGAAWTLTLPSTSCTSEQFRDIRRYLVDPTLQDNVLLPDDFAEYIYHIENAFEMHSTIKSGLIPGRKGLMRDRQSVFLTAVNPMCARQDLEEVDYDLDKPRIAPHKHIWRAHLSTVYWCKLKHAQRKGLQFYQTRSRAFTLSSTLPAIWKEEEEVVCMKIVEELCCKVYQSPRLPRVTLVPNSQHAQKYVFITDSRKSDNRENEIHKLRRTCSSSRVDFRIPSIRCWTGGDETAKKQLDD